MAQSRSGGAYRPEIDGLRAIAVLSVIAYHLGLPGVRSGYAGVDVFFVISGFLIGGIVLRERAEGTFTYRRFYARRVRRILPALCATILVILPFAWAVMTPHQLRYYGGAVVSTLAFLSNVWFYNLIDYFNPDALLDPLLHTWSLGVEEQFYLLFPPLVALVARLGRRAMGPVLAGLALASLAVTLATSGMRPTLSFYMLHSRMWELLGGVLAAMALPRAARLPRAWAGILAASGLILTLAGVLALPAPRGWPGPLTLIPVIGAVLIVLFASSGPARWILASPPFRSVGLISYSAYLIHHPLIVLLAISGHEVTTIPGKLAILVITLALAGLSWAMIEQPFRRRGPLPRALRRSLIAAVAGLAVFALGGHLTKGYPFRLPQAARAVLAYADSRSPTHARCALGRAEALQIDPDRACLHNPDARGPAVVIWGDSHVSVLTDQLARALPELPIREFSLGGCPPIPDALNILQQTNAPVRMSEACAWYNKTLRDWILAHDEVKIVVLYAYWTNYTERRAFDTRAGLVLADKLYAVPTDAPPDQDDAARLAGLTAHLARLVNDLRAAGKQVLVVDPLPIGAWDVPQDVARIIWSTGTVPQHLSYPRSAFDDYAATARAMLAAAVTGPGTQRLDLSDRLCSQAEGCLVFDGAAPLFFDTNHLSQPGVARIVPGLALAIRAIAGRLSP